MDDALPLDDVAEMLRRAQLVHQMPTILHTSNKQPLRLKNLCYLFYGDRAKEWELLYHKKNFNVFSAMPKFLRNEMLECMAEDRINYQLYTVFKTRASSEWCSLIYLLLNEDLKMLNNRRRYHLFLANNGTVNCKADDIMRVLTKVSVDCPNLEEFHFSFFNTAFLNKVDSLEKAPLSSAFYTILQFKNLKTLNLDFVKFIADPELADLCRSLPNLVSLEIDLSSSITIHGGLAHLSTLEHLKEFKFNYLSSDGYDEFNFDKFHEIHVIYNWCIQNLPNLENIYNFEVCHHSDGSEVSFAKHPLVLHGTSSLQVLCSGGRLPEATFPKLHTLRIFGHIASSKRFLARLSSYTKLTTLEIVNVQAKLISSILEKVGRQLTHLKCKCTEERFGDFKIFSLCPNLRSLENSGNRNAVGLLHKCCIAAPKFITTYRLDFEGEILNGLLKLIISSPAAESISIGGGQISKKVCQSLYADGGVKNSSLRMLLLHNMLIELNLDYREIERMAGSLVCNLPNLNNFIMSFKGDVGAPLEGNVLDLMSVVFSKLYIGKV